MRLGDAMAVFSFKCGSAVEVSASIGSQLEVFDATTFFARDAAFDISLESHINSCSLQGHFFLAARSATFLWCGFESLPPRLRPGS
jgi:hypothetical protein